MSQMPPTRASVPTRGVMDATRAQSLRTGASVPRQQRPHVGAARLLAGAAGAVALALAGCNSAASPEFDTTDAGTYQTTSDGNFFVDPNSGGNANALRIASQFYGRLVTIVSQAADGTERVIHTDFVVDPRVESSWPADSYELRTNPVTGEQSLVILADYDDTTGASLPSGSPFTTGRAKFLSLLSGADAGRIINDEGFLGTGTYTMVPRNAAVVFVFDDLVDPATLNNTSVSFLEGTTNPTQLPLTPRYFLDRNHGDLADFDSSPGTEFYSTRLIVDAAVSELDNEQDPDTILEVNNRGFPASVTASLANIQIRFPTAVPAGQTQPPLQTPSGGRMTAVQNGTFVVGSSGTQVVRAFRSGGSTDLLGDPFNGYLPDEVAPSIVSTQSAGVIGTPVLIPGDSDLTFNLPAIQFASPRCAPQPVKGDIIVQDPYYLRVVNEEPVTVDATGLATNVEAELIVYPSTFTGPDSYINGASSSLQYRAPLTSDFADRPECFLSIVPTPTGGATDPDVGLAVDSRISVRFNEAIDADQIEPYETFTLSRRSTPTLPTDYLPATIGTNAGLTLFEYRPTQPLAHVFGQTESYYFLVNGGASIPTDLAGNAVEIIPSSNGAGIELTLEANEPTTETGGHVFRFSSRDEQFPFADANATNREDQILQEEWSGTATLDTIRGRLRGRSVIRFQQTISQTVEKPIVQAMTVSATGTSLPLNPSGALTQWVWRYVDMGLDLYRDGDMTQRVENSDIDLDVEAIYLSPFNANPVFEVYPQLEIAMAHAQAIPDEAVTPQNQLSDPNSGMRANLEENSVPLGSADPLSVVHPRAFGLTTQPGDTIQASDDTILMPFALNQSVAVEDATTFTWRDTSIRVRTGYNGSGVPEARTTQVGIYPSYPSEPAVDMMGNPLCGVQGAANPLYAGGLVRTVGLPLLIQVKCYPTTGVSTQNLFAAAMAYGASNLPAFRAYTSGGSDQAGQLVEVNPDDVTVAMGGFDPTTAPPGQVTPPIDNTVYIGAVDFVTRISRAHSVYVPAHDPTQGLDLTVNDIAGDAQYSVPEFLEPTIFPTNQPDGTDLRFQYRAARSLTSVNGTPNEVIESTNAFFSDPYGDFYRDIPLEPDFAIYDGINYDATLGNAGDISCFDGSMSYYPGPFNTVIPRSGENPNTTFLAGNGWIDTPEGLTGAVWVQSRITFIANIATGRVPEISSFALNWREQ